MLIKSTKRVEVSANIDLPAFYYKDLQWLGVFDEQNVITITDRPGYVCIQSTTVKVKDDTIVEAINEWAEITEADFMEVYKRVLQSLSLEPVLTEAYPPDHVDPNYDIK